MRANVVSFVLAVVGLVIFALLASPAPAASTGAGLRTTSARSKAGSDPPGPVEADGEVCGALAAVSTALNKTAEAATPTSRGSALGHLESEATRLVSLLRSARLGSFAREALHDSGAVYPYPRGRSLPADISTFHGLLARFEADLCGGGSGN